MADNIQGTTNIWPYYSAQNVQAAARKPVTELGKDQFLQILVTQLRNQDPMQPMQDKEFIAQMAQFSSLEQMTNMSNAMTSLQQSAGMVASLIGKEITWMEISQTGSVVEYGGIIDAILWSEGVQYARIGESNVRIDDITSISEPSESDSPGDEVDPEVDQ